MAAGAAASRLAVLLGLFGLAAGTTELTSKTWDDALEGKNAFVKFLAPWCGHCKSMKPDWDRLAEEYKGSRSVLIADVDCTADGKDLCSTHSVQGFPTIKVFKKDGNKNKGDDYSGGRDFNSLKKYVDANLAGPSCGLEDKEGCTPAERKILEESEKMSVADRRAKIKEIEAQVAEKKKQADALVKEAKELGAGLAMWKAGGEKPDRVIQLLGDAEFREHCEHRTCILGFLPHILDTQADGRNKLLKEFETVFKKSKSESTPAGFMWLQGGDQFEIEEKLQLQFGFPAVVAINLKKERYGVHRGTFDVESLTGFLRSMQRGKVPLHNIPKGLAFGKATAWDGKDAEAPKEEEL